MEQKEPKKPSQLMNEIFEMEKEVAVCNEFILQLKDKLCNVLREEPCKDIKEEKPEPQLVPAATKLRNCKAFLREGINVLQSLIDRLEA